MATELPALLTICGLDEIAGHGARNVTHVLSILDPGTPDPDFGTYPTHVRTLLRFHDIIEPAPGMVLPTEDDVQAILAFGRSIEVDPAAPDAHLLVHCHAGISRSTAAMTMIMAQADPDLDEKALARKVEQVRPIAWPNLRMIDFADKLLGRAGRLSHAVGDLYGRRLAERPDLEPLMVRMGRGREVEIGLARRAAALP